MINKQQLLLTLSFIILNISLISSSCIDLRSKVQCSGSIGQFCGTIPDTNIESLCSTGLFCNPFYGECQPQSEKGGPCIYDKQCKGISTCRYGVCSEMIYGQLGQSCQQDHECGSGLDCMYNVCANPSSKCSSDIQCSFNQFCSSVTSTCSNRVGLGETCSDDTQKCQSNAICQLQHDGQSSICVAPFSVGLGGACSTSSVDFGVCDHTKGLLCNTTSNTCESVQDAASFMTSTPPTVNCNLETGSGCKVGESCLCSGNGQGRCFSQGQVTTTACGDASVAFYNCMNQNQCNSLVEFTESSCAIKNCGTLYCQKQKSCFSLSSTIYKSIVPSCSSGVAMVHTICDMIN
ncbi:hypothetical protein DFA_02277 [Cavenderia fasciculata]|uniref:Paramecium surface antigen repeat-containing protein n=1 Tax=Cavenderia fasciculata TaxID=261658 RepID=F4PZ05_CACFS|nr:uncharacterized protein DFA_02277 [Cavenderia fasciculata]EGG19034.1 hypothetical protein DFA_02277 [Cavenderia fasciculata]|eukprot:XP_004366667.1 hypothetical protein DFA_02277 [Cavenderia fasciculata]